MNAEITETVNLEAKSVWLSRIHFSDEPQRKRSKNNKIRFLTEKCGEMHRRNILGKYRNLRKNTHFLDSNDRGQRDELKDM